MFLIYFVVGYCGAALSWYLNHRFVFHGSLGRLPVLSSFRKFHTVHHRQAYTDIRNNHIFIPAWGHLLLGLISLPVLYFSIFAWIGSVFFAFVYGIRHYEMHNGDTKSFHGNHHFLHHTTHPKHNFSGVHPIIDSIFGTMA